MGAFVFDCFNQPVFEFWVSYKVPSDLDVFMADGIDEGSIMSRLCIFRCFSSGAK